MEVFTLINGDGLIHTSTIDPFLALLAWTHEHNAGHNHEILFHEPGMDADEEVNIQFVFEKIPEAKRRAIIQKLIPPGFSLN